VDLKYSQIEDNIRIYQAQLQAIQPKLNREQQKMAQAQEMMINDYYNQIEEEKENEKQVENIALQVLANGGDQRLADMIANADNPVEAATIAGELMNSGGWQYVSTPAERDQLRDQGWEIVQAGGRTYARQEAPEIAQQRDLLKLQQEYATPNNQYQYITGDESHPGGIFNRNTGQFTQFQTDVTGASVDQIAEAIKSVESGGNYEAQGGSGEFGAYQFMPETWADWSSQYADEVLKQSTAELEPTPENQDAVAKWKIQQLVNQGYTPQQVASIWNSGSPEWEGKTGTNQYGINYDVPNYVRKVTNALQNMAGQGQISPLAKKVIDDPSLLQTMTPTKATEIREELANAGYDVPQVIGFEDKINLERD
jgi:hypothetical protein